MPAEEPDGSIRKVPSEVGRFRDLAEAGLISTYFSFGR